MLDEFIWGKVSRISPEAPVPVVNVTGESYYPGGAANVARNLREFTEAGCGDGACRDGRRGRRLVELLASFRRRHLRGAAGPAASTTVKTRIIARNQQVVRVDRERKAPLTAEQVERAMRTWTGRSKDWTRSSLPITARASSPSRWRTTSAARRARTARF